VLDGLAKEVVYELVDEVDDEEAAAHGHLGEFRVHLLAHLLQCRFTGYQIAPTHS